MWRTKVVEKSRKIGGSGQTISADEQEQIFLYLSVWSWT